MCSGFYADVRGNENTVHGVDERFLTEPASGCSQAIGSRRIAIAIVLVLARAAWLDPVVAMVAGGVDGHRLTGLQIFNVEASSTIVPTNS